MLRDGVVRHVQALQVQRELAIEQYTERVGSQITTLAADPRVLTALRQFAGATQQLEDHPLTNESAIRPQMVRLRDYLREYYAWELKTQQLTLDAVLLPQRSAVWLQATYVVEQPDPAGDAGQTPPEHNENPYGVVHAVWHPVFQEMAHRFGWDDILLVDALDGRIVYSMVKTPAFQTGLFDGPYARSNLGALFREIHGADAAIVARWADFAPYVPLHGRPVAFAAAPIVVNSRVVGAVIVELSSQPFTDVLSVGRRWADIGLGATGDVYLVGPDRLMRSESRFVEESRQRGAVAAASSVLSYEVPVPAVPKSPDARSFAGRYLNHRGTAVLGAFGRVDVPNLDWSVFVEVNESEALRPLASLRWSVGISALGMLVFVAFAGGGITWWVVRPATQLVETMRAVARGDLSLRARVTTRNEFAHLARALNALLDRWTQSQRHEETQRQRREVEVQDILSVVTAVTGGDLSRRARVDGELASLANAINGMCVSIGDLLDHLCRVPSRLTELTATVQAGTEHLVREAACQVDQIGQASSGMRKIIGSLDAAVRDASETEEAVRRAGQLACSHGKAVRGVLAAAEQLYARTRAASGKMKRLGERSMDMLAAAGQVACVAADLNMMAVNAAIDEARHSVAGRGAVAAEEVRKLAKRADLVREELARALDAVRKDIGEALTETGHQNEQVEQHLQRIADIERRAVGLVEALAECGRSASVLAQEMRLPGETARSVQEAVDGAAEVACRLRSAAEAAHAHVGRLLAVMADWPTPASWRGEPLGNRSAGGNGTATDVPTPLGAIRG